MKRIISLVLFLFLSNSIASFGNGDKVYSRSTVQSSSTISNVILNSQKSSSVLFEKSGNHKTPIKPKKKKRSRGIEPHHYFICDLSEQFVFNIVCSNSIVLFFSQSDYNFGIYLCHNERGPPSLV